MENWIEIYVIMWKVYEYVKNEMVKKFCLIVVLLQKTTFIWDGRNPLSVIVCYSQETSHAHQVKRTSSLSNKVNKQGYSYLLGDGMMASTGTDQIQCSCRTDCNTRHCLCLYFVQTNVPMWHLTHNEIEVMPFTWALSEFFISEYSQIRYIRSVLIRIQLITYYCSDYSHVCISRMRHS